MNQVINALPHNNKMDFSKIFVTVLLVTVAVARPNGYGSGGDHKNEDRDYKFQYSVNDAQTSNQHSRLEQKNGKSVHGEYKVLEPTGDVRLVKYYDDGNGFYADVQKQGGYSGYGGYGVGEQQGYGGGGYVSTQEYGHFSGKY